MVGKTVGALPPPPPPLPGVQFAHQNVTGPLGVGVIVQTAGTGVLVAVIVPVGV